MELSPKRDSLAAGGQVASPLPTLAVAIAIFAWGFGAILVRVMSIDGISLAFYRLWFGFLLMAAVVAVSGQPVSLAALRSAIPGGIVFGVNVALFFSAVNHTTIANANLISALQPALVLVIAGPIFGESIAPRTIAWTGVSIIGVAIVIVGGSGAPEWSPLGDAMAIGALVLLTAYFIFSKQARATVGTMEYMLCVQFVSALTITPIALVSGHTAVPQGLDWLWMVIIVFGTGTGAHFLINWAHAYVDVSISSLGMLAVPVVAGVAAWLLLDESLTPVQIAGIVVTLIAMIIVIRGSGERGAEAAPGVVPADALVTE